MADSVKRAEYWNVQVPNRPGEGARHLSALAEAGVNLLAFSGFPEGRGAQLDFIPENPAAFRQLAKKARWKATGPKRCFLIAGDDRVGAVADATRKLAEAGVNITAVDAVCAGGGRYGAILWVAARDVAKATRVLGAE